jgi:hypothetical protein
MDQTSPSRRFRIYRDDLLVLEGEDRPGILVSLAAPPPLPGSGPVTSYLTATFTSAEDEGQLGAAVRACSDTDGFLDAARDLGYRVEEDATLPA